MGKGDGGDKNKHGRSRDGKNSKGDDGKSMGGGGGVSAIIQQAAGQRRPHHHDIIVDDLFRTSSFPQRTTRASDASVLT
jgi:hypothetical protein